MQAPSAQALQGGEPGNRDGRGLLEAEPGRFVRQLAGPGGGVFGEGAAGDAEHLLTGPEPGDAGAGRHDRARHVQPGHGVLRPTQAKAQQPHEVGLAGHQMPGAPVHPGRPYLHQDLVRRDRGRGDPLQPEHILGPGAVPVLHDRLHCRLAGCRAGLRCRLAELCWFHRLLL